MSTCKKYQALKQEAYNHPTPGIFYAFSDEQFAKGMKENGYDDSTILVSEGCGGFGTQEAYDKRRAFFRSIDERIKAECNPDDVYIYEYQNCECDYAYDDSEALRTVRDYFPGYTPSKKVKNRIAKMYNE